MYIIALLALGVPSNAPALQTTPFFTLRPVLRFDLSLCSAKLLARAARKDNHNGLTLIRGRERARA